MSVQSAIAMLGAGLLAVLLAVTGGVTTAGAATVKNGDLVYLQGFGSIVTQHLGDHYNRYLADGFEPKYSPDGKQIAYIKDVDYGDHAQREVYVHDLKTNRALQKTTNANAEYLAWSPDGNKIVYSQLNELKVLDLATYEVSTIYAGPGPVKQPAWSPDGTRIAFSTGATIDLVTPSGTKPRVFTTGGANTMPDWSPDSRTLAFITTRFTGSSEVVTLPRSGKRTLTRVSHTAYPQGLHHIGVAWSPDGTKIAVLQFNANHEPNDQDTDERFKVVAYQPDGSSYRILSDPIPGDDGPEGLDWAPRTLR